VVLTFLALDREAAPSGKKVRENIILQGVEIQ
jgi:hypothetical protein